MEIAYTRHDFGFALFLPLGDFGVDLITHFAANLASVAREQSQEPLSPRIYHVDFVKRNSVDDFFAFLYFTFRTLNKFRLRNGLAA